MDKSFDLIVLGAGSGGLAAAKRASSFGANVAIVEGDLIGGTCVIRGCVPKKLMVYGSLYREYIDNAHGFGISFDNALIDSTVLMQNIRDEVLRLNQLHNKLLLNSGIEIIYGWAKFLDSHTIAVQNKLDSKQSKTINGKTILISVGGVPIRPNIKGAELGWVSDDVFSQKTFPGQITIIGAGYIACEFACIFNRLGIDVTLLVRGDTLLRGFDRELSNHLLEELINQGVEVKFHQAPIELGGQIGEIQLKTEQGLTINTGAVLFATGRRPRTDKLQLESAGVNTTSGRINVDKYSTTNIPNIFAIGDVTDRFNLTPVAIEEGRAFSDRLFGERNHVVNYQYVPSAVFSQPEIASVGHTEQEAIKIYGKENIRIFKSKFRPMSKALPKTGCSSILKLIVDIKTDKVIGCHMSGENAAEIIQMSAVSLVVGARKSDFDRTMALHPTVAEEFVTMT